jgi:hypothetical protein
MRKPYREKITTKGAIQGHDPVSQLYRAIIRYVKFRGGDIMVIGGIEIQEWPDEFKYNFRVAVRCTGKKPTKEAKG